MDRRQRIEEEIGQTLDQMDRADRLPPDPHFYARVMARLEERSGRRGLAPAILRPALLTMLVVVNLITAVWYFGGDRQHDQAGARRQLVEILGGDLKGSTDQGGLFLNE